MSAEWRHLATAPALVTALDLDGTLLPFAPNPAEAPLDPELRELLAALAALPGVTLGIVSGRPRALLAPLAREIPRAALVAEHAAWHHADGAWHAALPPVPQLGALADALGDLARRYPGALVERKTCSVCLHWRQVAERDQRRLTAAAEALVDEWLETQPTLERVGGAAALEVRDRAAHAGAALPWLRARAAAGAPLLAIGADATDEDMFVSLREGDVGILVAATPRRTQAGLRVPSIAAARGFLRWLVDARQARPTRPPPELLIARAPIPPRASRLVVVSNRLPAPPGTGRRREVGGLVSALLPVLAENHGVWLGWSGAERDPGLRLRIEDTDGFVRAQFDYPPPWRSHFYGGFCNRSLWPLLHGFVTRVRYVDDEWRCYGAANRAYARLVQELGGTDAEVWVQDYHLLLAGRELRAAGHRGRLGFYLHVPFPALDIFETLPWAAEVISALLAYDLLGFQTQRWADNFIASARALLGADAEPRARDRARVIPVGIDPDRFARAAAEPPSPDDSQARALDASLVDRALILGVDRLDYSKGIPERLEAYARLLERSPTWRSRVSFVQVSVPSRADVPEYGELRSHVEALVGRINGAYGEADWVPVRYLYRSYDQDTLARLYRDAAVGLVTPLRDGMNLVAKEFVAAQDPDDPGVLLLSRFAGAAQHLTVALLTNPYHVDGLAADLDRALRMPRAERVARNAGLRSVVWRDTAAAWAASFRDALLA